MLTIPAPVSTNCAIVTAALHNRLYSLLLLSNTASLFFNTAHQILMSCLASLLWFGLPLYSNPVAVDESVGLFCLGKLQV